MARVPVAEDFLVAEEEAALYEKLSRTYLVPLYKHFVWKTLRKGIRGGRALDIGCGHGLLDLELAGTPNTDFEVVGIDISPPLLRRAVANARKAKSQRRVSFVLANASRLPFPDASFDLVISHYSLHLWAEPEAVLNEIHRVIKKGGILLLRDGRRLQGFFSHLFVSIASSLMSPQERQSWQKAIHCSYTPAELEELLRRSPLQGWQVKGDEVFIDLCLEWQKGKAG